MTQSPKPIQSVEAFGGLSPRHPNWSSDPKTDSHLGNTPASSTSLAVFPAPDPSEFDVDKLRSDGFPLLVRAASDSLGEIVEKLLASGTLIEAVHTETERIALIEASLEGRLEDCRFTSRPSLFA